MEMLRMRTKMGSRFMNQHIQLRASSDMTFELSKFTQRSAHVSCLFHHYILYFWRAGASQPSHSNGPIFLYIYKDAVTYTVMLYVDSNFARTFSIPIL